MHLYFTTTHSSVVGGMCTEVRRKRTARRRAPVQEHRAGPHQLQQETTKCQPRGAFTGGQSSSLNLLTLVRTEARQPTVCKSSRDRGLSYNPDSSQAPHRPLPVPDSAHLRPFPSHYPGHVSRSPKGRKSRHLLDAQSRREEREIQPLHTLPNEPPTLRLASLITAFKGRRCTPTTVPPRGLSPYRH